MRLLANENFPGPAVSALRAAGHDVVWIHEDAPGIKDPEVMARARAEDRVLLTFDKDFGELVFHLGEKASNGIVLFRIMGPSPEDVTDRDGGIAVENRLGESVRRGRSWTDSHPPAAQSPLVLDGCYQRNC